MSYVWSNPAGIEAIGMLSAPGRLCKGYSVRRKIQYRLLIDRDGSRKPGNGFCKHYCNSTLLSFAWGPAARRPIS